MIVAALVAAWLGAAALLAVLVGRSLTVCSKSDRWRHGRREVRDVRLSQHVPRRSSDERTAA